MIFWGGLNNASGGKENYGWSYNPATDSWSNISHINAPEERAQHTAVWTGSEMMVWGGCTGSISPSASSTAAVGTTPATMSGRRPARPVLQPRVGHTAVWAGSKMIVWGGCLSAEHCNDTSTGGLYDPATNTWTASATFGAPSARHDHTVVWTGSEMIIWGGHDGIVASPRAVATTRHQLLDAYQPRQRSLARIYHTALWAQGDGLPGEMIVWGGCDSPAHHPQPRQPLRRRRALQPDERQLDAGERDRCAFAAQPPQCRVGRAPR